MVEMASIFAVVIAIVCFLLPWVGVSAGVRPLSVSAEARKEMAKYSLSAYENADPTNKVKALLFGGMTL